MAENKEEIKEEVKEEPNPLLSELDRADQIAQMQKRENDRKEELIKRDEQLQARKVIGGTAEAGTVEKPVDEDLKKKQDAAEFFKGTKLEADIMKDVKS